MTKLIDPVNIVSQQTFEQPFDSISLPSKGVLYPENHPLHKKETIDMLYMTAADEDILTSPNLLASGEFIQVLLRNKVKDKRIDVRSLLKCDSDAILVWLRSSGYGPEYDIKIRCGGCNEQYDHTVDLSTLDIKYINEASLNDSNLFEVTLGTDLIEFSLLTFIDEDEIKKSSDKLKKQLGLKYSKNTTQTYSRMIKSVNGNTDLGYISKYVENMPLSHSTAFRKMVYDVTPGIIMRTNSTCTFCDRIEDVDIPLTTSFFWPDATV